VEEGTLRVERPRTRPRTPAPVSHHASPRQEGKTEVIQVKDKLNLSSPYSGETVTVALRRLQWSARRWNRAASEIRQNYRGRNVCGITPAVFIAEKNVV